MRADVFTPAQRSAVMRAVKSAGTAPEQAVSEAVCALGFRRRYRRGARLPGRPDFAFPALRKAILVHGCFWHGHDCKRGARQPKDNSAYWATKIAGNRARDAASAAALVAGGWKLLVVWECQIGDRARLARQLQRFLGPPPSPPTLTSINSRRRP
jgi:DNA mismatch endonuclease, patch repair protein